MSANNALSISHNGQCYEAHDHSVDIEEGVVLGAPVFTAETLEEAVIKANKYCEDNVVEYGYAIMPKEK